MKQLTPRAYARVVHEELETTAMKFLRADRACIQLCGTANAEERRAYATWCTARSAAVRRLKQLLEDYD